VVVGSNGAAAATLQAAPAGKAARAPAHLHPRKRGQLREDGVVVRREGQVLLLPLLLPGQGRAAAALLLLLPLLPRAARGTAVAAAAAAAAASFAAARACAAAARACAAAAAATAAAAAARPGLVRLIRQLPDVFPNLSSVVGLAAAQA
jgi:hypothetical protein